ncbi:MAG: hypothetical protein Q4C48_02545 [Lachnospiraceae bacterium]|nr:hypothetical protein [Lachnospiraceae bacterium]
MPFCPVCKKEFPSEVTICPTCNVSLVNTAQNTTVSVFSLRQESAAEHFISYMHEQGLEGTYEYSMREDTYKIYVEKKEAMRAVKLLRLYMTEAKKKKEAAEPPVSASAEEPPVPAPEQTPVPAPAETPASVEEPAPIEEPMPAPAELPLPVEEPVPAPVEAPTLSKEPTPGKKPSLWERLHISKPKQEAAPEKASSPAEPLSEAGYIEPTTDPEEPDLPDDADETPRPAKELSAETDQNTADEPSAETSVETSVETEEVSPAETVAEPIADADENEENTVGSTTETDEAAISEADEETESEGAVTEPPASESFLDATPATPEAAEEVPEQPIPQTFSEESEPAVEKASEDPEEGANDIPMEPNPDDDEEDAFSAFLSDFKRNSLSKTLELEESGAAPIIEEIYPHSGESHAATISFEPQEPKIKVPTDTDIIEAVVDASVSASSVASETKGSSSSFADPTLSSDEAFRRQAPRKPKPFTVSPEDDPEDSFHGFVPDYAPETEPKEAPEPTPEETAMDAFRQKVAARKEEQSRIVAEKTKEAVRKANLVKDLSNGQKIVFEDTDELDNYAGFVPDYTPNTTSEEEFSFYQPRTVSDYSKYKKKGNKASSQASAPVKLSHMRITNANEVAEVFSGRIPSDVKHTVSPQEIKTTTFLCSMTGAQLTKLFHSWMMTNVTAISVRTFETPDATAEENYDAKIEGIKKLLVDTFGDLNEVFLDTVVRKYYSKYLDD